jgi:hypothetical protein
MQKETKAQSYLTMNNPKIMMVSLPHSYFRICRKCDFSFIPRVGEKIMLNENDTVIVNDVVYISETNTIKLLCK